MRHGVKVASTPLHRMFAGHRRLDRRLPTAPIAAVVSDPNGLTRALALAVPVSAALWVLTGLLAAVFL